MISEAFFKSGVAELFQDKLNARPTPVHHGAATALQVITDLS